MRIRHLLLSTTTLLEIYHVYGHCIDIHSRIVSQGLHYVPGGTNPCTLCICDKGGPKWCKSVLCSPPQNCKSFQVGSSCCEFKCLDDILSSHDTYKDTYDVALRFIATTITAVLSISLLFFLYNRLKRNKSLQHHTHQHEEQRNLSNVGYIAGNFGYNQHNIGYMGTGNNEMEICYEETNTNFSLWKPPGNYFPPGEAPPPYEEAMRTAQSEMSSFHNANYQNHQHGLNSHNALINSITSTYPQEMVPQFIQCRHDEPTSTSTSSAAVVGALHSTQNIPNTSSNAEIPNISSNTHQYVNVRVQVRQHDQKNQRQHLQNHQQQSHQSQKPEASYENIVLLKSSQERQERASHSKSSYHKTRSKSSHQTTTEPSRLSNCSSLDQSGSSLTSTTSSLTPDTYELVPHIPQLLATSSVSQSIYNGYNRHSADFFSKLKQVDHRQSREVDTKKSMHRTLPKNLRELLSNRDGFKLGSTLGSHQLHPEGPSVSNTPKVTFTSFSSTPKIAKVKPMGHQQTPQIMVPPVQVISVPLIPAERSKDIPMKSLLTYQSLSQDEEDYRSECENCKTAKAATADDDHDVEAMNETMSLQRRPLSESGYELAYRTSLTLPAHSRKQNKQRSYSCTSNLREKWFTSMQQTSSEESD